MNRGRERKAPTIKGSGGFWGWGATPATPPKKPAKKVRSKSPKRKEENKKSNQARTGKQHKGNALTKSPGPHKHEQSKATESQPVKALTCTASSAVSPPATSPARSPASDQKPRTASRGSKPANEQPYRQRYQISALKPRPRPAKTSAPPAVP